METLNRTEIRLTDTGHLTKLAISLKYTLVRPKEVALIAHYLTGDSVHRRFRDLRIGHQLGSRFTRVRWRSFKDASDPGQSHSTAGQHESQGRLQQRDREAPRTVLLRCWRPEGERELALDDDAPPLGAPAQ